MDVFALQGHLVRLEPLTLDHAPGLLAAAREFEDDFAYTYIPRDEPSVRAYIESALRSQAMGTMLPFATIDRVRQKVIGTTRYGDIQYWEWPSGHPNQRGSNEPDALEVGWTWLAKSAQRSGINREAKLLMLSHAFEAWRVHRVNIRADANNVQSRRAIEDLGAHLDGVLRADKPAYYGDIRDTACYSILRAEWPVVKARLERSLRRL